MDATTRLKWAEQSELFEPTATATRKGSLILNQLGERQEARDVPFAQEHVSELKRIKTGEQEKRKKKLKEKEKNNLKWGR